MNKIYAGLLPNPGLIDVPNDFNVVLNGIRSIVGHHRYLSGMRY